MIGERERMSFALEYIKNVKERSNNLQSEFKNLAQKLPAMLVNSGVLMTIAFVTKNSIGESRVGGSAGEGRDRAEANRIMLTLLIEWLKKVGVLGQEVTVDGALEALLGLSPTGLMIAHDELLRLAEPLKLLAEATLKGGGP